MLYKAPRPGFSFIRFISVCIPMVFVTVVYLEFLLYSNVVAVLFALSCFLKNRNWAISNQHNLVPAKGMISLAEEVTAGLVDSNGSLPPGL